MATYALPTNIILGNNAESVPKVVFPFRDALNKLTGGTGVNPVTDIGDPAAGIDVSPLSYQAGSQDLEDGLVDGALATPVGGYYFAYGSGNRATPQSNPFLFAQVFGMEIAEFFSWWYEGTVGIGAEVDAEMVLKSVPGPAWVPGTLNGLDSGMKLMEWQIAQQNNAGQRGLGGSIYDGNTGNQSTFPNALGKHDYANMIVFPICATAGESGGWFKEAVTLKKMTLGKWSDGSIIKIRLADEPKWIHLLAFPNVAAPDAIDSTTPLADVANGNYNCLEYNMPLGDSSTINGLFPNWPDVADSIIALGIKHYYIGTWQTPFRGRVLLVNRWWYNTLTIQEQQAITSAAYQCAMSNLAYMMQGQDAIIDRFQLLGGVVHESLPRDYLGVLREATDEIMETYNSPNKTPPPPGYTASSEDSPREYEAMMRHCRAFCRHNSVRWRSGNLDRRFRFGSRLDYVPNLQPDVKL